jgi:hypothetical protein
LAVMNPGPTAAMMKRIFNHHRDSILFGFTQALSTNVGIWIADRDAVSIYGKWTGVSA